MTSISPIERQFDYLKKMRFLLGGSVNTDAFSMIDSIEKETKLSSNIIYTWIKETYANSQAQHIDFDRRFFGVKKDLLDHLDTQICRLGLYLINTGRPKQCDNFWLSKTDKIRDPWFGAKQNRLDLLQASLHISDILFAAKEVLNQIDEKRKEFEQKELTPFIETSLAEYISLLPESAQEFKVNLMESFGNLRDSMKTGNIELASEQLLAIEKISQA